MNTPNSSDCYIRQPETFTSLAIAGVVKHTNARLELLYHIKICQSINFGDRFLYVNTKNGGSVTYRPFEPSNPNFDRARCMHYHSTPEQIAERVRILRNME
jgi:hypothetical protein